MTPTDEYLYSPDESDLAPALVGRRIVQAEIGETTFKVGGYDSRAEGRLVLDDGTVLYLGGNEGCGGCSSGWYGLTQVAKVDNLITNVRVEANPDDDYEGEGAYRIFVIADAVEINVAEFEGSDGNGYYGSGFWVVVQPAE